MAANHFASQGDKVMGQEIITSETPAALTPVAGGQLPTPMELLSNALTNNASVDIIERLMALQTKWEERESRKAFSAAISSAKALIRPIQKNHKVDFTSAKGRTNYDYEDLSDIASVVDPILAQFGLSCRYRAKQTGGKIAVTCIVEHRDGYFEETTLEAGSDHSGNKNEFQAVGSAATYLQRYTLKLALGLSASKDDDANSASDRQRQGRHQDHGGTRAHTPAPDALKKLPPHTKIDWLDECGPVMTPDAEVCGKIVTAIRAAIDAGTREALVMALQFHAKNEAALKDFCQRNWEQNKSKIVNMNKGFDKVRELIAAMDVAPSEQSEAKAA
jgi:hypothetical protein